MSQVRKIRRIEIHCRYYAKLLHSETQYANHVWDKHPEYLTDYIWDAAHKITAPNVTTT